MKSIDWTKRKDLLIFISIFVAAAIVFSQYTLEGILYRDDALHLYIGQQFVKGIPPYVSAIDVKTPLSFMLIGFGIMLFEGLIPDDVLAARFFFLLLGSATVACVYLLGKFLYKSRSLGALASFTFIGFWKFGSLASSGPQSKIAMSLFQVLALLLTSKKYWFWAAFSGSLAFLSWQPMIIFPAITVTLSFLQSEKGVIRRKALIHAVLGAVTPILLTLIYFTWKDALHEFAFWPFQFILTNYIPEKSGLNLLSVRGILKPINSILITYHTSVTTITLGAAMLILTFLWRISKSKSLLDFIRQDPYAYFLLSLPIPIIWTINDYQGGPDLFVFLPYLAIGFAWMIILGLQNLEDKIVGKFNLKNIGFILISLMLLGSASRDYQLTRDSGLDSQRKWVAEINDKYLSGTNQSVVALGRPEFLVLAQRTSNQPFVSLFSPVPNYISLNDPQGLEGWLDEIISVENPTVIIRGQIRPIELENQFDQWLLERGYVLDRVGDWKVFVNTNK